MGDSTIGWTQKSSNPIHLVKPNGDHGGHWCKKISPGCANCYAEAQNQSNYFKFASHLKYAGSSPENMILDEDVLREWASWRQPKKIFVGSMTDVFGSWVKMEWLDQIFAYMRAVDRHTYLLLTKRPHIALEYLDDYRKDIAPDNVLINWKGGGMSINLRHSFPLKNAWIGTSIENQQALRDRRHHLSEISKLGWITFYSVEPLLEAVDLKLDTFSPNWVIVGGESGTNARPCHVEWLESVVCQCKKYSVPVFVKQLGKNAWHNGQKIKVKGKGEELENLPKSLQYREYP